MMIRDELLAQGTNLITRFCQINNLIVPAVIIVDRKSQFAKVNACAWYRFDKIWIKPWACAALTQDEGHYRWSYPGYLIDRTPYGVLAHEIGHHIDVGLSGICPKALGISEYGRYNPCERFAEFTKLFITNPDLLGLIRPQIYQFFAERFKIVEKRNWQDVLLNAPEKIRARCERLTKE